MNDIMMFILGIGVLFLIGFIIAWSGQRKRFKYIKERIVEKYGKEIDLEEVNIKMNSVDSYFRNKCLYLKDENSKNQLDDITWNDINMDDVFKKINNTQSTAGAEVLYDMLRNPLHKTEELQNRNNIIEYFRNNEESRIEIQYILGKLGKSDELYTTNCLFNDIDISKNRLLKYRILSYLPIISILLTFFKFHFIMLVIVTAFINIYISQTHEKYHYNVEGFTYMLSMIRSSIKIKDLDVDEIEINLPCIENDLKEVKSIKYKSIGTNTKSISSDLNVFSEYANMIVLSELKKYEKIKSTVIKKAKNIKSIYEYVGSIDALIGVASFRDSLDYYSTPTLTKSHSKNEINLNFKDIYHPLVKNPVSNSGEFSKGVLLTGSNASGKSTFIKTVAINAILAQSIYTTTSREYISNYFNIYTSMALKDSIENKESYYIVEIKSLKRILDSTNEETPTLCFVDEILRGTNTIERVSASSEVLKFLQNGNCLCFAATHDIELTHLLEESFENYHFEERITNKDIEFDYKLHKGRAQTRNAIKLLEFMEYDEDIVKGAENRAKHFLEVGQWKI